MFIDNFFKHFGIPVERKSQMLNQPVIFEFQKFAIHIIITIIAYSTFILNIGRQDGLTPKELMGMINKYSRHKGVEIGDIRIFNTDTKFEVEEQAASDIAAALRRVLYNGIPLELKPIPTRTDGGERRKGKVWEYAEGKRDRRDRRSRKERRSGEAPEKRRGRPGSNPKKPRNFNRSSAGSK